MFFESIDGQKSYHKLIKLDPISFRSPTLHPLTAPYAQTTPYPRACLPRPACRPPDTVVRRTQPILPCERARWLMLSGRCRRGGWRRPTGNSLRVGNPFRQPLHPFHLLTRLATLPSVKDVRFCTAETGAFTRSEEWPVAT